MKKLKEKIKKLAKLGVLVGVKEGYLFSRNLLGLYEHPLLTTKRIVKEKDFSQGLLIFGLPVYLWFGWIFILLVSRLFIFGRLQFGFWAKISLVGFSLFSFTFFLLLVHWLYGVFKKEGEK